MKKLTLFLSLMMLAFTMTTTAKDARLEKTQDYVIEAKVEGKSIGKINISLWPDLAPKTVENFDNLVKTGAYDGTAFHRCIPGFVIQGGDPNSKEGPKSSWGMGAPGQKTVPAEFSDVKHTKGILSMARKGNDVNSGTSQFFICVADVPSLNNQYTVFGTVTEGMDVVNTIVNMPRDEKDYPLKKVEMFVTIPTGKTK
ncbi:MAG: peptidylprolyl isomerase [Ignavibacteriae bacterium HGW-Ignavibacteriae-4]|jgi:peptidyl-prolyl cis-trans isomerase B (cyclophilin B)|nr:MAG: peptidylprolyl isomerase [Ignavibacteriae bacterium HGW-Ignavibacteriae-4]